MARNYGSATLKNHIPGVAPGTLNAMGQLFGVSAEDFAAAVNGDQETIKRVADMARLSDIAKAYLPKALEAYRKVIETTGDINEAYSELVKLTQKHGAQTLKAINSSQLAEQRLYNETVEMKAELVNATTAEATRHAQRSSLIVIAGATADLMALAKHEADLARAAARVPDAQDAADLAYETAVTSALWAKGSEAKTDRIPKPNFIRTAGLSKVGDWFKNFMGL
ncbi:hypothetical protein Cylst_6496 (plasmid) [Cylindrospermum stagnale PCC 7417]|uniref:Uncharacterized protein n=1 Tax=Cylindrospermum stagnale PCC 7417 TaxID=56107 RepID=K9X9D4_9NOST|nr:hypothetical protein [Cylindrospermum stagnale]AFZ28277.1 hypothetical protein Cylst_6496 [Cylindrospermum stagnale PCC 7417]